MEVLTFHEYAEDWWLRHAGHFRTTTQSDYRWRLERHLLPFFKDYPDAITFDAVERYIAAKLAEDNPLSARTINMTVILLGAILEGAVERDLIARNPAGGGEEGARTRPTTHLSRTAVQIQVLLDAAAELDRNANRDRRHIGRKAMIATLVFAGLRIGELCALRWRDVDLEAGWLLVGEAKTDAGTRRIKIRGALNAGLTRANALRTTADANSFVFATSTGKRQSTDNLRSRVISASVDRANKNLQARVYHRFPRASPRTLYGAPSQAFSTRSVRTRGRHGRDGAHRSRARPACLPPVDAARRGREGGTASTDRWSWSVASYSYSAALA